MELTWLIVIIVAYFFFSLANLGDKLVLAGPPKAIAYTFYVGVTNAFLFLLVPFINLSLPNMGLFFWILADALVYTLGLYFMYSAIERSEVLRVATVMGALLPIFVFILTWIFFGPQVFAKADLLAFLLLLSGCIIISATKNFAKTNGYIKITIIASLMFSFDYIFAKIVYLSLPFLTALFWMKICVFIFVLFLLLSKNNRKEILNKKKIINQRTDSLFVLTQGAGGIANILQAFAIFLAPVAFLPMINSLRGVQFVFLFLMTLFITAFFPKILKEKISKKIIIQKIVSIILIIVGLSILVIY